MALRNNVKRPLKSVQERAAEAKARTQAQAEKIAAKRNVTPQERAANVVNYGSMESSSLLKSMFSSAKAYAKMPSVLKPIYANSFQQAYNVYSSGVSDPDSPLYNPYSVATNYKAIEGLAQYGYDATQMTDAELRELLKYKRTTATGYSAAAPTQSSSAAENAAYWAQEYLEANERTAAAENELAEMQRTVDYYVNTLGLSDSEVVQRINASKDFPTLRKMMDEKAVGSALILNRAIDYSGDDTVMGMIFSARNGGQTLGSYALNAGAYAAGFGAKYEADEEAIARRDASNVETYNPYAGGTTLENLGLRYGVASFDRNWLEQNKNLLNTDAADDYRKIKTAVENSEAAEKELASLQEWVQGQQAKGKTAEDIRKKMAEEDFWDDYKTLKKMEDARQDGTSIAMGKGVDYTQGGFSRYIDSLYPEPTAGEVNGVFRVTDYVEQGGDERILRNEVERWINGRGTTSAEGEAFVKEYGWLFGGEVEKASWGDTYYVDERKRNPKLGKTAYNQLAQAQEAAADGAISNSVYVDFAMSIAEQMEQAEAAGLSLEDYLANGEGRLPDIGAVIERGRENKRVRDEERAKAEALAIRTTIEEADAAVANGTATAAQQAVVDDIRGMDVSAAISESPAVAEARQNTSTALARYAQTNLVGKLASVYGDMSGYAGSVKEAEAMDNAAAIAGETAANIANIATSYFDEDYKRAALMGVDMETYYELYPERVLSVEDAYQRAFESYTNTWAGVWGRIDRMAKQAQSGAMVLPAQPLSAVLEESEKGDAAYDAEQAPAPLEYGEGVGAMQTVRSSVAAGGYSAAYGTLNAIQYFVTSSTDAAVEAANRSAYPSPEEYRTALEQGVANINDPEERDAWTYLLNNYKGDIYKVAMNFDDERVKNAMRSIQRTTTEIGEFMQENGTEVENIAFDFGSSTVSNAIYLTETGVLTALGVPGAVSAAAVYGAPSGAEMGRRLEAAGLNSDVAKGAALGYAAFTGWLESSVIGEYIPNLASGTTTSLAKRGLGWLLKKDAPVAAKVLNWAVAMPVSEAVQEGMEYVGGAVYEGVFQSIAKGDIRKAAIEIDKLFSGDELVDNAIMGGLMAPLLGAVGAGMNTTMNLASAGKNLVFNSSKKAMDILEAGEATAEDVREFAEALEGDMQSPEFVEQAEAVATEMQRAETVISALLRNDPETASAIAQKAQEQAKLRKAVSNAESALEKAQTQQAQYQELLDESTQQFLEDASDQGKADYVREMTALVAEARRATEQAQESLTAAREAAEGAELEMGQYQQQRLAEARQEAKVLVAQAEASADQMEQVSAPADVPGAGADTEAAADAEPLIEPIKGTPMSQRDIESIKDRKMRPIALDNPQAYSFFQMAAAILEEDLAMSTEGGRMPLGEDMREWTGWKRNTTELIANLKDSSGMTWARLRAMATAYANGDTAYIQKHQADAKRIELALDQMLAEGYTNINKSRMEAWPDYRELMGYPPKADVEYDIVDEDGKLLFYQGKTKAAEAATQNNGKKAKLQSPVRVAQDLASALRLGKYVGPKGSEAQYDRMARLMRISSSQNADYLRTMHEIGHSMHDLLNMTATPGMVSSGMFGENAEEAFAEFFFVYMANRPLAVLLAGDEFVRNFEQRMRDKKVYKAVNKAAVQVNAYFAASTAERVYAQTVNRSNAKNKFDQPWRRFRTGFIGHHYAGKLTDRLAGNPEYGLEQAIEFRAFHERAADICLEKRLIDMNGNTRGRSYASMLKDMGIRTKKDMDALANLMLMRHALDRSAQGKGMFNENMIDDAGLLDEWTYAPQHLKDAAEAAADWWWDFAHIWFVESGVVSEAIYDDWKKKYRYYVPTFRDVSGRMYDVSHSKSEGGKGGWKFHRAGKADLDIIHPLDGIAEQMRAIVRTVALNTVGQKFDELYQGSPGLGVIAQQIELPANELPENERTGDEMLDYVKQRTFTGANSITVTRADGTRVAYQFADGLTYRAIVHSGHTLSPVSKAAAAVTRAITALTTGSNPIWGLPNVVKDIQGSVIQGHYAVTPFDAAVKWVGAAVETASGKGEAFEEYENMGGGGWADINTTAAKGGRNLRKAVLDKYSGENAAEAVALAGDKLFNVLTFSKFNEIGEQTTRVANYKVQDRSTVEKRRAAFLDSQNATLNFSAQGLNPAFATMKAWLPYSNPAMQAIGQSLDIIEGLFDPNASPAEKADARQKAGKIALNAGITAAIMYALRSFFSDEEKEALNRLTDDIKAKNIIFPTRWIKGTVSDVAPERMFVRIPLGQNILYNLLYAGTMDAVAAVANTDDAAINFREVGAQIVLDSLPVDLSGFVLDKSAEAGLADVFGSTNLGTAVSILSNRNWYGASIVSPALEGKHETQQYDETTPTVFVEISNALYKISQFEVSPLALQYASEQTTGFWAQVLVPFLSRDQATEKWDLLGGLQNVGEAIRNKWTIEPLSSNEVVSSFYDYGEELTDIVKTDSDFKFLPHVSEGADREAAYAAAEDLLAEYKRVSKEIKEISAYISEIYSDESLSSGDRVLEAKVPTEERIELMEEFIAKYGEFQQEYGIKGPWYEFTEFVKNLTVQ